MFSRISVTWLLASSLASSHITFLLIVPFLLAKCSPDCHKWFVVCWSCHSLLCGRVLELAALSVWKPFYFLLSGQFLFLSEDSAQGSQSQEVWPDTHPQPHPTSIINMSPSSLSLIHNTPCIALRLSLQKTQLVVYFPQKIMLYKRMDSVIFMYSENIGRMREQ
jgi:hypothetical protein